MPTRLSPGTIIDNLQIVRGLYLGSFQSLVVESVNLTNVSIDHVYLAESPDGALSVIKLAEEALVETEAAAYQLVPASRPEYQYHASFDERLSMLVTKYRGPSLLQHLRLNGGRFSARVVSRIGVQMVSSRLGVCCLLKIV